MSLVWGDKGSTSDSLSTLTGKQGQWLDKGLDYFGGGLGKYSGTLDKIMAGQPLVGLEQAQERFKPFESYAKDQFRGTQANTKQGFKNLWSSGLQKTLAGNENKFNLGMADQFAKFQSDQEQRALQGALGGMAYGPDAMLAKLLGTQATENVVTPGSPGLFGGSGLLGIL